MSGTFFFFIEENGHIINCSEANFKQCGKVVFCTKNTKQMDTIFLQFPFYFSIKKIFYFLIKITHLNMFKSII
jgi:hypothetical protein